LLDALISLLAPECILRKRAEGYSERPQSFAGQFFVNLDNLRTTFRSQGFGFFSDKLLRTAGEQAFPPSTRFCRSVRAAPAPPLGSSRAAHLCRARPIPRQTAADKESSDFGQLSRYSSACLFCFCDDLHFSTFRLAE